MKQTKLKSEIDLQAVKKIQIWLPGSDILTFPMVAILIRIIWEHLIEVRSITPLNRAISAISGDVGDGCW